ncbi:MAG: peptidoglycan-binding protein, partial [Gallionella sp.]
TDPFSRNKEMAYTVLFKAWGAKYQEGSECSQAEAIGLRCLSARGWLDELRRLNLPAILLMQDKQGRKFNATLTGLDERSATFTIGDASRAVPLAAFAAQWSGHYTLLWRVPPVASKQLRLGDYGPDVEWLGKQLAQLDGKGATTTNQLYDEAMMRQVKQFQLSQGLISDGFVGPQTMMHLSAAIEASVQKLHREQEKK